MLRKFKEGGRWLHRALELLDDIYGEDHPGTVLVHLGLSTMCQAQNKWEAARDHLIRAWEVKEDECRRICNGPEGDSTELAEIYGEMGKVYLKLQDDKTALDMYTRALRIYKTKEAASMVLGKTAQQAATIQSRLGQFEDAFTSFQIASEVFEISYGLHHKKTLDVWRKVIVPLFERMSCGIISCVDCRCVSCW